MKDSDKSQALFEAFASGFFRELLAGGRVQLTRPLGAGLLDHFAVASCADSEVDEAIYERLHSRMAEHAPVRALAYPCRATRAFAMAVHDLLVLTDPLLDRAFSRRARPKIVRFVEELLEASGAPQTRGETLARHVTLSAALKLKRTDIVVKNWAYTYRFFGRPVPHNVVMLPTLRRVRQTQERTALRTLLEQGDSHTVAVPELLQIVIRHSPYTRLLHLEGTAEPLFDLSTLAVLSDPGLMQSLVFEHSQGDATKRLHRFGAELWKLYASGDATPRMLRIATDCVFQLGLAELLWEEEPDASLGAGAGFELALAMALPAAMLDAPSGWPWLSHADNERAQLGARTWADRVDASASREAKNIIARASLEAELEVAS